MFVHVKILFDFCESSMCVISKFSGIALRNVKYRLSGRYILKSLDPGLPAVETIRKEGVGLKWRLRLNLNIRIDRLWKDTSF